MNRSRFRAGVRVSAASLGVFFLYGLALGFSEDPLSPDRYMRHIEILASDALKGRGNGSPELEQAAEYIASEFRSYGLKPGGGDESYFQAVEFTVKYESGADTGLRIGNGVQREYKDFALIPVSSAGAYDGPVVFAGYGITAPELGWDDYAGIDVTGKAVVVFFHSPEENSATTEGLGGPGFRTSVIFKIRNARQHGARAILLVMDPNNHTSEDEMIGHLTDHLDPQDLGIVAMHVTRESVRPLFQVLGKNLSGAQRAIDDNKKPQSFDLADSNVHITGDARRVKKIINNVLAAVPGSDEILKKEWIVVGAHYDHLGLGGIHSPDPRNIGKIHHGADDNASGTAGVIELARLFQDSARRPKRSILFVAFAGEELGMIGSNYFADHPPFPLSSIAAMINLDMIGRLTNLPLNVLGSSLSADLSARIREANKGVGLTLAFSNAALDSSDHIPFQARNVPAVAFFSGLHEDYHSPSDTAERIDTIGAIEILSIVSETVKSLANSASIIQRANPGNVPAFRSEIEHGEVYFGSEPAFHHQRKEVFLRNVQNDGPAEKAGLKDGDVVLEFSGVSIKSLGDFASALDSLHSGDMAAVIAHRNGQRIKVVVTLEARRRRAELTQE